ncbi:MAG: LytTR family DNA-binding domain-containing protein [Lachnospiraceae bacterium]|nr:LytTR family DNA-binding domain-containing protein [Lachnospiraceae bacterium]
MKIRAAVCEKDVKRREYVVANIRELPLDIECKEYNNIYDLKEVFHDHANAYDIIFVAATFNQHGDGLDLAKYIREVSLEVAIVVLADNRDYYREAFDVFAMAYLLKPLKYRELDRCLTFYTKNSKVERRASWMVKGKGGHWVRVFCRDILYIESNNREIVVHLSNGTEIASYAKLGTVEEQLPEENFIRCHQSYIINIFYANEMTPSAFHLDEMDIPISRKFQPVVKEKYYQYMFNRI